MAAGLHFRRPDVVNRANPAGKRLVLAGRHAIASLLLAGISLTGVVAPTVSAEPAPELAVKAAFILNFLKFVEWPADSPPAPGQPLVVLLVGSDPLGAVLAQAAADVRVAGRPVQVRAADPGAPIADGQIVFIAASAREQLPAILRRIEGRPVLTVGATEGFGASGVVLNLVVRDRKVRVEANTAAAARARLRVSAHLLRLARIVG